MSKYAPIQKFPYEYGKYTLLERIGEGGMAEIFKARLPGVAGFEKIVVVKRIRPELAHRKQIVDMFVAEATLAALVQHPNVVQVYELDRRPDGEFYMVMEYVEGTDLRQVLRGAAQHRLRIPPWLSLKIVSDVLGGLSHAHGLIDRDGRPRNVVHRDVSPSNVFIANTGDVKLGDFGVAKDHTRSQQTQLGQLKGKLAYMAPEQLYHRPIDQRTDIFAAGVVLWECLTQRRLFGGKPEIEIMNAICDSDRAPPSRFFRDVPPELDRCLLTALEPSPDRRPQTSHEFQEQLLDLLAQLRPRILPSEVRRTVQQLLGQMPDRASAVGSLSGSGESSGRGFFESSDSLDAQQGSPAHEFVEDSDAEDPSFEINEDLSAPPEPSTGRSPVPAQLRRPPRKRISTASRRNEIAPEATDLSTARAYDGPHPFFVREPGGRVIGPKSYFDALVLMKARLGSGTIVQIGVSARGPWLSFEAFAELTGQEALLPANTTAEIPPDLPLSNLENSSVTALLAQLAADRATGRLVLTRTDGSRDERREVYVEDGFTTYVYSNKLSLQLPEFLLHSQVVHTGRLPELLHHVVEKKQPLEQVVASSIQSDFTAVHDKFMMYRLVEVMSFERGMFVFDTTALPSGRGRGRSSLLGVLPRLVSEGVSAMRIRAWAEMWGETRLMLSNRFSRAVREMILDDSQFLAARQLAAGTPINQLLAEHPGQEELYSSMAYLLVEAGLLHPAS